jgi:uncharacterized protein YjbJ (UPF0337 family)
VKHVQEFSTGNAVIEEVSTRTASQAISNEKRGNMMDRRDTPRNPNTANTNSAARDRAAGNTRKAKGRLKESWGALTGNERIEAEGREDQVAGQTRVKKGQWKDRIKSWIDRL